jgi:hypothetical protein
MIIVSLICIALVWSRLAMPWLIKNPQEETFN